MKEASPEARDRSLPVYVLLGTVAGAGYVLFDLMSEARIRSGTLSGALADVHALIDHTLPVLVGALLGVGAHYVRLRARLSTAERAAARADALRTRLQKVERDQAVWVLAAAVLHELNNPLHAIGLLLDELMISGADGDEARRDDLVERARAQAERARRHLAALRGMRTLGEPELQSVTLEPLIGALADDLGHLATDRSLVVRLECDASVRARADPTYVRTILENLVDNALSSVRERGGGHVVIRLSAEDGRAVVRVRDDGPEIDPEVHAALFEPLRTTKTHGLGLGLPIARALARAMSGELSLESGPSKTFRLELPLS
ncbi:MAG TPA: HAMP domain-containing sensor histidine kinase [Polyangiaceae bacterium]|nr:HAMP domain-containing sensor histidine kinase [Polyangiaceae bacterium]